MHQLYLLSVWLHLLAMATWVGGMVFLAAVALPVLRQGPPGQLGAFMSKAGPRLRWVGWICLTILGVTGLIQLYFRGLSPFQDPIIAVKILVYLIIVAMSLLHDFWIGPKAGLALRDSPTAPTTLRLRRVALMMGRVTALLALLAVTLGLFVARGTPW